MENRHLEVWLWLVALVMCVAVCLMAAVSTPSLLGDGVNYIDEEGGAGDGSLAAAAGSSHLPLRNETTTENNGKISINTADRETLMTLDGIGEVLAQRIIDYREIYGDFASVDELLHVEGIGEKRLEAIRDQITV